MKNCDYCGKANEEGSLLCLGCGSPLPSPQAAGSQKAAETSSTASEAPGLNARRATTILAVVLGVQLIAGLLVMIIGIVAFKAQGHELGDTKQLRRPTRTMAEPIAALATVSGGLAMLFMSRSLIREQLSDASPTGAAWFIGSSKQIAQGVGIGVLTGVCYAVAAILWMAIFGPHRKPAAIPVLLLWLGVFTALVLAPLAEEPLFRGLLYGGYRRSFGPLSAAILTTVIFCIMHVGQMIQFPPVMVGTVGVALAALWFRLRSAAIGPAIAVHFGYNATVLALSAMSFR